MRELASDLLPSAREISQSLAEHLVPTMPELAAIDDDELREETRASSEANVDQVVRLLRLDAGPGGARRADRRRRVRARQTRADHYEGQVEDGYAAEARRVLSTMPAT